tara:strand:- start:2856 stop:4607 length:1752 start_codon:yes stop_codon:yes gene_type:complete
MKLTRIFISNFLFFLFAVSAKSGFTVELPDKQPEFLSPDEAFIMSHELINDKHVRVSWKIQPGYYLYMGMFEFESLNEDNKINRIEMPDGKKKTDEFFGDVDIYYFSTSADIFLESSITETADFKIKYQGCADAGLCYPPVFKKISLKKKSLTTSLHKTSLFDNQTAMSESLTMNSLFYNTFIFYLAGLLLAFTPCVLPMVPILTGIIAGRGNVSQKKSLLLSCIYVFSMSLTYAFAGIIVATSGTNIQASLQSPYVIGSISLLFFLFALAMFKFFNIQMPKSIQTLLTNASNKQKSGGLKDVAIMGVLSALIVGPCVTAPLIGALIYIASTGDVLVGGLALFALGIGMGTPLIALGSTTTKLISKIGPYLELVNYFFGVLFVIVSLWLLERILSIQVAAYLWAIAAIISVVVLIKASKILKNLSSRIIIFVLSSLSFVYVGLQIYGVKNNSYYDPITSFIQNEEIINFVTVNNTKNLYDEINNSSKPVMVDLYADWCVACKELEKYTFSDRKVSEKLNELKLIKFDITNTTDEHSKYLQNMMIFGPPALFFYDGNGKEITEARVVGFVDSENFLEILKLIKR